jgi:hypothetical protein
VRLARPFHSSTSKAEQAAITMLFWCGGGDEFLEGRILAQWLKHWIRAEQRDAPDLGFRNRRFHRVPFRFKRRPIYEGKTQFFTISTAFTTDEEKRRHSSTISSTRISLSSCENPSKLAICRTVIAPESDHRWHAFYVCPSVQIQSRISGGSSKCASA